MVSKKRKIKVTRKTKTKTILIIDKRIRFILVGGIGAIVELTLFSKLMSFGLGISISNFCAFHFAFVLCFFLHYRFTHKKPYFGTKNIVVGLIKYTILMYLQLLVGTLMLWVLIEKLVWVVEYAKIVQICLVTPFSYLVQRHVIFREKNI